LAAMVAAFVRVARFWASAEDGDVRPVATVRVHVTPEERVAPPTVKTTDPAVWPDADVTADVKVEVPQPVSVTVGAAAPVTPGMESVTVSHCARAVSLVKV